MTRALVNCLRWRYATDERLQVQGLIWRDLTNGSAFREKKQECSPSVAWRLVLHIYTGLSIALAKKCPAISHRFQLASRFSSGTLTRAGRLTFPAAWKMIPVSKMSSIGAVTCVSPHYSLLCWKLSYRLQFLSFGYGRPLAKAIFNPLVSWKNCHRIRRVAFSFSFFF